jgi:alkylation response protein AidB-like acyl-CoA dehydrogenase
MQLELSAEDAAFREEMRTFFTTQVPQDVRDAVAERRELTKDQMVRSQQTLNAAGLAVPHWPVEWGGRGWSALRRHIWHEEMQRACVPPPLAFNASMVGPVIATFGSQEQKERFLPPTANLDIWWSQGFSEPDAGSDLASLRTTAVRDPSAGSGQAAEYVVNGQKTWTTLGQYGDWIFCLVRTDPTVKKQLGISFLLIDMRSPGVTVRPIELIDGGHEVNEVWFEDVRVPVDNLVGVENKGWDYAKFLLGNERVGVAPVGSTKRVLAQAKEWAKSVDLLDDPLTAARIAELENELLALELTALRVVAHSADGKPHPASSVLKLKGTELQQAVSELVVDLAGPASLASGAGEDSDLPGWSRRSTPVYLNLRKASIYGGSNEVQRQIIAKTILGL